jgi:hypothetical protein
MARQHLEAYTTVSEVVQSIDQAAEIPSQPVQLPDVERVALPQRLQASRKPRPIVAAARGAVPVDLLWTDPGLHQGVTLQVENLATINL